MDYTAEGQPDHLINLLPDGDMSCVNDQRIPGLDQRTFPPMAINIITFKKVGYDGIEVHQVLLFEEFALATECPDQNICGQEQFEGRIREHHGTDITSVHDDPFVFS